MFYVGPVVPSHGTSGQFNCSNQFLLLPVGNFANITGAENMSASCNVANITGAENMSASCNVALPLVHIGVCIMATINCASQLMQTKD
uniref:Uncharacterized protein n=1 Tax=Arundo donax TaxID=35708 RepID=A0A0A9GPD5_ARUDO